MLTLVLALSLGNTFLADVHAAESTQSTNKLFQIAAGNLDEVLNQFARQAEITLSFDAALAQDHKSNGLKGVYGTSQGLELLLVGTGLRASFIKDRQYSLSRVPISVGSQTRESLPSNEAVLPGVLVRASAESETAISPVRGYIAKRSATGTKTDTPIIETPQSISVVTADRVEAIGATTLREVLGYTPGVNIEPFGPDSRLDSTWINLRGLDAYQPGPNLDGLPLRNNLTWAAWRVDNYGSERTEILRGPSSVLYGQVSPGGTVNVVSKRPTAEPLHELQVQLGSNQRRQLSGDFSGPLDAEGQWLYRLTGTLRDGQYPVGGVKNEHEFIAPSLTWQPNTETSLTLLTHWLRDHGGVYSRYALEEGTLIATRAGTKVPVTFLGDPGFDHMEHEQWAVGYAFQQHLQGGFTFRQNLRHGKIRAKLDQVFTPITYVSLNPDDETDPANYRQVERYSFGSQEAVRSLSLDNQLESRVKQGRWSHILLAGLDYQRHQFDQTSYFGNANVALDLYKPVYGQDIQKGDPYFDGWTQLRQTGLYGQWQGKLDEQLVFTLGGRQDWAKVLSENKVDGIANRQNDSRFSGRAGAVWLMSDGWAPYLSYATSFFPVTTINPNTGKSFSPETGSQWEMGLRWQPPDSSHSISAAVFDLRRQNYITNDVDGLPRQLGEVTVRGLEVEALLKPTNRMNLTASYTYTPTSEVSQSSNPAELGLNFNGVSQHGVSLWADYRFEHGLIMGLGTRYTGANHGINDSAKARVPSHTLWDAMLGYGVGLWDLRLNVRNLTNENYIASCGDGTCYFGDVRRATLTATYRW